MQSIGITVSLERSENWPRDSLSSSTSPGLNIEKNNHANFFEVHNDPKSFKQAFSTMAPTHSSFNNEWGLGRMILIPGIDAHGRKFAFGASISVDSIALQLKQILLKLVAIGKTAFDVSPPELAQRYHQADLDLINAKEAQSYEADVVYADGSKHRVIFHKSIFKDSEGCVAGIVGAMLDITEKKQAEEELNETKMFLDSIVENIPVMIFVKEAKDLRFVRFNKAGEELLGYSRDELLGKSDFDFFTKEQAQFFINNDREVLSKGKLVISQRKRSRHDIAEKGFYIPSRFQLKTKKVKCNICWGYRST